jgi:hypothetical protein
LNYLDKVLDTLLPEEVYDYNEEETEDSIYEDLYEEYKRESQFSDYQTTLKLQDLREEAQRRFNKRERSQEKQEQVADFVS